MPSSPTWTATTDLSTIALAAASAEDGLCDGGTVSVTISVLSAPGDGTYEWTTTVPPPFTVESQPTLVIDGTPPETTISPVPPQVTGGLPRSRSTATTRPAPECRASNAS
jgi:hypothetical protein